MLNYKITLINQIGDTLIYHTQAVSSEAAKRSTLYNLNEDERKQPFPLVWKVKAITKTNHMKVRV